MSFATGDLVTALLVGLGRARSRKSETEKDVLQKTVVVAASTGRDDDAGEIATTTLVEAQNAAMKMK